MDNFLKEFRSYIVRYIDEGDHLAYKIGITLGFILLSIMIYQLINQLLLKRLAKKEIKKVHGARGIIKLTLFVVNVLFVLLIWNSKTETFIILILVSVLVMSLILRGMLDNMIAFFLILNRHYIELYNRIEINGMKGEVIKINVFNFKLMELNNWFDSDSPTGRVITIPNKVLLDSPFTIYEELTAFVWNEVRFTLTADSDWQKALNILKQVGEKQYQLVMNHEYEDVSDKEKSFAYFDMFDGTPVPSVDLDLTEKGITLYLNYLVHYKNGTSTKTRLYKEILTAFSQQNITLMNGRYDIKQI
ncbi:mechanosensitive ion channel domain-containing protein [Vagococcus humatus]|uniref:Mechanosensitive ion channel MscS domain-containing protein n=1 Tax=Vagococcus humatus TaxID=1889241 RepID=A0A3R9YDY0_9ENTE|nr:mechanosensitive ion channel family protein [Vagococcus humatus]RST89025.1 hypothetical protein C7P63_06960 [Vagococcus humatus]